MSEVASYIHIMDLPEDLQFARKNRRISPRLEVYAFRQKIITWLNRDQIRTKFNIRFWFFGRLRQALINTVCSQARVLIRRLLPPLRVCKTAEGEPIICKNPKVEEEGVQHTQQPLNNMSQTTNA